MAGFSKIHSPENQITLADGGDSILMELTVAGASGSKQEKSSIKLTKTDTEVDHVDIIEVIMKKFNSTSSTSQTAKSGLSKNKP